MKLIDFTEGGSTSLVDILKNNPPLIKRNKKYIDYKPHTRQVGTMSLIKILYSNTSQNIYELVDNQYHIRWNCVDKLVYRYSDTETTCIYGFDVAEVRQAELKGLL